MVSARVRDKIVRALRNGYGAEDIKVMHGIDVDIVRNIILNFRNIGALYFILGTSRKKNLESLKIIGIVDAKGK